jgi:hypothetical protein
MGNVGAHLDALPGGRDGRVHPEPARLELDDGHADVGGDAAESQRLLLLEQPYAALHRLMDRRERVRKNGDFFPAHGGKAKATTLGRERLVTSVRMVRRLRNGPSGKGNPVKLK